MKPILFNTEMVRAILDGRKSVTRRVVGHGNVTPLSIRRPKLYTAVEKLNGKPYFGAGFYRDTDVFVVGGERHVDAVYFRAPYRPGDILYVRERWRVQCAKRFETEVRIEFKAGGPMTTIKFQMREEFDAFVGKRTDDKWHPSIHMPKEAARLFLRVTKVRVERLQDITPEQCDAEGVDDETAIVRWTFNELWDSTIKKADLPRYGWEANPWVWVIEFERIRKEEALASE